jgi:hypothetical protein
VKKLLNPFPLDGIRTHDRLVMWSFNIPLFCQIFHTVFIRNIPIMNLKTKSEARRFITMIDTFYDNKTRFGRESNAENIRG